jgi:hypothetical protein
MAPSGQKVDTRPVDVKPKGTKSLNRVNTEQYVSLIAQLADFGQVRSEA